ncbi:MAG: transporter ATP-binding protein [Rhodoferax sp.]|nr:transporter ATP-binding protein [Rhodoferax sp.]
MLSSPQSAPPSPLLSVQGLTTAVKAGPRELTILEDVSFDVDAGQVLALVGESGSGKSMTALSIMRLLASPAYTPAGKILFESEDLLQASEARMQQIRGAAISMIFQEPMSSLNPVFSVGEQIAESLRFHRHLSRRDARAEAIRLLDLVEIPQAASRVDQYPHQMSGGMRQRVMIAMALACKPRLLIADEPTTALDVTVQAQILALLRNVQREFHMAVMLITHDLGIVTEFADDVLVLYAGRVAERAPMDALFDAPSHPYTHGLLASIPPLNEEVERLTPIRGNVPSLAAMPAGCRFAPRCDYAMDACRAAQPALRQIAPGHDLACKAAELGVLPFGQRVLAEAE